MVEAPPTRAAYAALIFYCWFTLNNGFAWLMFAPATHALIAQFPGMSIEEVELLNSWQPAVYIVTFLPCMMAMAQHGGLRRSLLVGCGAEVVGACVKTVALYFHTAPYARPLLHMGQMCSALGAPVAIGAPPLLSAIWFPPSHRTRSTGWVLLFNNVGNAVAYAVVPLIVVGGRYVDVAGLEVISAIACFLAAFFMCPPDHHAPHAPHTPHAAPQTGETSAGASNAPAKTIHTPVVQQLRMMLTNPSVLALMVGYAWSSGGYVAWTSLFDATLGDTFSTTDVAHMAFTATIFYIVGGFVVSQLTDRFFATKMKAVIILCVAIDTLATLAFAVLATRPNVSPYALIAAVAVCGFFNGGCAPLYYELCAELTYPVSEGVSGVAMSVAENIGSLILYDVVGRAIPRTMNEGFGIGIATTTVVTLFVREAYRRRAGFEARKNDQEGSSDDMSMAESIATLASNKSTSPEPEPSEDNIR